MREEMPLTFCYFVGITICSMDTEANSMGHEIKHPHTDLSLFSRCCV